MTATNDEIAAALRTGQKRWDVARALGVHYQLVCRIAKQIGIPKNGYRHGSSDDFTQSIIEAYARLGSFKKVGAMFGVSYQAVGQIIQRYEVKTGQTVPRSPPPTKPRSDVFCRRCGRLIGKMTAAAAQTHSGHCKHCSGFLARIPDAQIEEWVSAAKAGSPWIRLAEKIGVSQNAAHRIPLAVYTRLHHDGRLLDINALWPRGVPAYILKRVHARKAPSVRIPHLGKVS